MANLAGVASDDALLNSGRAYINSGMSFLSTTSPPPPLQDTIGLAIHSPALFA